ncbi:MAG TPA: beta-L-arabinofuranosidase domain-containing protein, partial [Opitutaceae bacterium]|nr:beta-L-arabinofuranosidase domain-containing protein [Opitutaceae bacterium]
TLYNGILPGIGLEGKDYFYVNALRKLQDFKTPLRWSRTRTPNIKSSFCCPPNVVRTIAESHNYVYGLSPGTLWVHLFAASTLDTAWTDGARIKLRQETDYPWSGAVKLVVEAAPADAVALKVRIPGWLHPGAAKLRINGEAAKQTMVPGTYAGVKRAWQAGDIVQLDFDFAAAVWEANPLVEETLGQVAVKYGPLVYCAESNDLPAGVRLAEVALSGDRTFAPRRETIAGARVLTLTTTARALQNRAWRSDELYREAAPTTPREIALKLVPYYAWGNRGDTEMTVWLPVR